MGRVEREIRELTDVLKRTMEKCCNEICSSIKTTKERQMATLGEDYLWLTIEQANGIIDMENHGYSEGLGPLTEGNLKGWSELLEKAETITGRKADGSE